MNIDEEDISTETENEIIDFIKKLVKDLTIIEDGSDLHFINNNIETIIITNKNFASYVKYEGLWEVLEDKYKLKNGDMQYFIKSIVDEEYNMNISLPSLYAWL